MVVLVAAANVITATLVDLTHGAMREPERSALLLLLAGHDLDVNEDRTGEKSVFAILDTYGT